jgi:hypothetical protein
MNMFDGLSGNLDDLAAKVGLPADQVKTLTASLGNRMNAGGDHETALAELAAEHGLPVEKLQEMLAGVGGPDAIMAKLSGLLDRDGDGNPLNELGSLAKGLFG